ncbi:MAG: hypothetical protein J0L62_14675 [Bacteroidetes bacterium]|nr:hypothetical protein [Bacteroidota bacterium]
MKTMLSLFTLLFISLQVSAQETTAPAAPEKKEKGSAYGITAGLLTPTGDYGETYGVTPHIGLRFKTPVGGFFGLFSAIPNLHNDVFISYGLSSFTDDYKSRVKKLTKIEPEDADAGNALTVVNTLRYTFKDMVPLVDPYAGVGIGVSYVIGGNLASTVSSLGSFGYGFALKGGAQMPLTDWFAIDVSADYLLGTYSFFNLGVSAMFTFGGKY